MKKGIDSSDHGSWIRPNLIDPDQIQITNLALYSPTILLNERVWSVFGSRTQFFSRAAHAWVSTHIELTHKRPCVLSAREILSTRNGPRSKIRLDSLVKEYRSDQIQITKLLAGYRSRPDPDHQDLLSNRLRSDQITQPID